jgi:undecaprenyl-diphosphatase
MSVFEAILLGLLQGFTEFLPVSSSGHLELGKAILGVDPGESLAFTIAVHGATVFSTIIVFRNDIAGIFGGLLQFRWNEEVSLAAKLVVSMIPVAIVGVFFREDVESFFDGDIRFVGSMLMVTALLLTVGYLRGKGRREIGFIDAFIIGIAQAVAVLPGISRSGSTIATGLMIGNDKANLARFSFLMVLVPIIGANLMDISSGEMAGCSSSVPLTSVVAGATAAFLSGWLACRWMIGIVRKGKLIYFAAYCFIIALVSLFLA